MSSLSGLEIVVQKILEKSDGLGELLGLGADVAAAINRRQFAILSDYSEVLVSAIDSLPSLPDTTPDMYLRGFFTALRIVASGVEGHAMRYNEQQLTLRHAQESVELLRALTKMPMTTMEVAKVFEFSAATASRKLRELLDHDLVSVIPDAKDGRKKVYCVTLAGKRSDGEEKSTVAAGSKPSRPVERLYVGGRQIPKKRYSLSTYGIHQDHKPQVATTETASRIRNMTTPAGV